jgi:hypothetical protein
MSTTRRRASTRKSLPRVICGLAAGGAIAAVLFAAAAAPAHAANITITIDRKFPVGKFCPLESRAAAGANLSFVATATSMPVTFSAFNLFHGGNFNDLHLDNISVQLKSVFDSHLLVTDGYGDCYDDQAAPPGQSTPGMRNAPAYNFTAAGTTEISLDTFNTNVGAWTGSHLAFDGATIGAPPDPSLVPEPTPPPGSLKLGADTDGNVVVTATKTITGLTVGQTYVVFGWWKIQETDRLVITVGTPCTDPDGDGYVDCTSCAAIAGQTCGGDCAPSNAHCNTNCTDADGDGWCVTTDCNDAAASCTNNCAADVDADGTPDCRDGCIDTDHDGYGTPGGATNTCLGGDCAPANPYCNASCVDADGDGRCAGIDCNDANAQVGNDLAEINDWIDQQCPGNQGYGVTDEISGNSGFLNPANKNLFSWPAQSGATQYVAVRSSSRTFTSCTTSTLNSPSWNPGGGGINPPAGTAYYFLVRSTLPKKGSFGQRSNGAERAVICGMETNCGNAIDDDADGSVDCADADCSGTAACRVSTFAFTDTTGDDIADNALYNFFQANPALSTDYIFFQMVESPTRTVAWCSLNAAFYKTNYMNLAPTFGSAMSGSWNKWRKAPITGNAWQGPDTTAHQNDFGDNCFGTYTWCSEQFPTEPKNSIFPDRTNDCESYDLTTGFCGISTGATWQLTIRIAPTRLLACGF